MNWPVLELLLSDGSVISFDCFASNRSKCLCKKIIANRMQLKVIPMHKFASLGEIAREEVRSLLPACESL